MVKYENPPYWYWPLDRWKLAFSLLLLVILIVSGPRAYRIAKSTIPTFSAPVSGAVFAANAPAQISGRADPGNLIQIYDNDNLLGATTADATGQWSFTLPMTLFPGEHKLKAQSLLDPKTPLASSEPLTIIIAPPIQNPPRFHLNAATYHSGQAFSVSGTADPNATIQIFDGDEWLGQTISDENGLWSFSILSPSAGRHTLYAKIIGPHNTTLATSQPFDVNVLSVD
ncbi:MAG: Ig-like domain repeat protein [Chloroflexi bacterium]|nr:Ig-like domain repeat protein [Chloroflexota bacterium]